MFIKLFLKIQLFEKMKNEIFSYKRESMIHLISGAFSGIFSDLAVHPFDTVQTRIVLTTSNRHPKLIPFIRNIIKEESFFSLWKGFGTVFLSSIPGHSLYFTGYELSKSILNERFKIVHDNNMLIHFVSGCIADVSSAIVYTPSEVIKQKLQIQINNKVFKGTSDTFFHILKTEGFRGLFKAFYFVTYEQLKIFLRNILDKKHVNDLPFWGYLTCGAISSGILSAIFSPIDFIRTRIQLNINNEHSMGFLKTTKRIKEEGILTLTIGYKSFFRCIKPSVISNSVGTALTMLACKINILYIDEECKKFLYKIF